MIIGLNIYMYVTDEAATIFETVLSILIILNSLICPYTNSQLLKIYPSIINSDIPSPRKPCLLIFMIIVAVPMIIIPVLMFVAYDDLNDIVSVIAAFIYLVFISISIMMSILQHLIFFGSTAQKFIRFDGFNTE